jgi:hypothetical protein
MTPHRPRQDVQAYVACAWCGASILSATTVAGLTVHLDVPRPCFDVAWADGADQPTAFESRAYALHVCCQNSDKGLYFGSVDI